MTGRQLQVDACGCVDVRYGQRVRVTLAGPTRASTIGAMTVEGTVDDWTPLTHAIRLVTDAGHVLYVGGHGSADVIEEVR